MKRTRLSACVFAVATSLAACHGTGDVEYAGAVSVTSPALVTVSPGVQVVEDADEPLFFADGSYWLYRDNVWLRSNNYRGGFARVDLVAVPSDIRVIERPQIYAHYRANQTRYRDAYARDRERSNRGRAPAPMANPPPVSAPEQPNPQQQSNPIPRSSLPPAANPEQPMRTPNDMRREPEAQRMAPAERPDHTVTPQGLREDTDHGPAPAAQTPVEDANPTPSARTDDRSRDNRGQDNRGKDNRGKNTQQNGDKNRDDVHHGNPSAPSQIAPTAPSNSPTTPSQGATSAPDKDRHDHDSSGKADRDDQATPPVDSPNNASMSKDKKDAKKNNEKY